MHRVSWHRSSASHLITLCRSHAQVFGLSWFFERFQTSVNVLGDGFVCKCVDHLVRSKGAGVRESASLVEEGRKEGRPSFLPSFLAERLEAASTTETNQRI